MSETSPPLAPAGEPTPVVVRSHRNRGVAGWDFRWFWAAFTVSTFGDQITLVALPLAVYARTENALSVGIAASMQSLTAVTLGLLAGTYADRLRHRPILVSTDLISGVLLGAVAIVMIRSDDYSVSLLYGAAFGLGALRVLHDAAAGAALPRVVRGTDLLRANGRLSASESAGNTGGFAIGGALIYIGGFGFAFGADALSFVLSGLAVSRVLALRDKRVRRTLARGRHRTIRADVGEGLRAVWADRPFMHGLVVVAAMNVVAVAVEVQFIPFAEELLDIHGAAIVAFFVVGGLAGLATAVVIGGRGQDARGDVVLAGVGFFSAGVMVAGLAPSLVTAGVAYVAAGVGSVLVITHFTALRQRRFPVRLLGRVGMASRTVLYGLLPFAHLGGGWLARAAGPDVLYIVLASIGLIATAWGVAVGFGRVRMGDVIDLTDTPG